MWIHVYPNWKTNFNFKIAGKICFSYKTKASISFIPIRRMCLWCQRLKSKEIIIWIHGCPNRRMNINSKHSRKRCFSYETKASISLIPIRRICLWCPILERKEIIMWICDCPNWQTNISSKNGRKRSFFLWNQKINIIPPIVENVFMVPNVEKKGDYYANPWLSKSMNEH